MSATSSRYRRSLTAALVAVVAVVLLSAGATVARGDVRTEDSPAISAAGQRLQAGPVARTAPRRIVAAVPQQAAPSFVQAQLHAQRSGQLQSMFETMLQSQSLAPVTPEIDPRVDAATCALLGRTWSAAGCSRQTCIAGHEYAKTGANAETCRIGGRRGASYGVEIDFRRCDALHRTWIGLLNYCASDPHRTESVVPDAAQCQVPYTSYVLLSETEGSYDECVRPERADELQTLAASTGQPLALVAGERSRTQCGWRAGQVFTDGVCGPGAPPAPGVTDNVAVIGDSITWRGTNELATLEPDWVIDGSSGRQIDALDERLAAYRAANGEPGGVIFALGTNGRSGWTQDEFRASIARLPATTPVLFVTPFREAGSTGRPELMDAYSSWMRDLVRERPRTCVADWRTAVTTDNRLLVDGVHPTSVGEIFWAEMVDSSWDSCLRQNGLSSY